MGYVVDIHEYQLTLTETDPHRIEEVLESLEWLSVDHAEGELTISDCMLKWSDYVYHDLVMLSEIAEGYIVFRGEDGEIWKIEIKDGELVEYSGEIVFHRGLSCRLDILSKLVHGCYHDHRIIAMIAEDRPYIIDRLNFKVYYDFSIATFMEKFEGYLESGNPERLFFRVVDREAPEKQVIVERLKSSGLKSVALAQVV